MRNIAKISNILFSSQISDEMLEIDGQAVPASELTEEQQERVRAERRNAQPGEDPFHGTIVERPWLMAAKERLGIRP